MSKRYAQPVKIPTNDGRPVPDEPQVETLATLVLEKRGAQRRTRFIGKDGSERVTEWRDFDHGMYAQAAELRKAWTDELMEGVGRIPPGASRVYR